MCVLLSLKHDNYILTSLWVLYWKTVRLSSKYLLPIFSQLLLSSRQTIVFVKLPTKNYSERYSLRGLEPKTWGSLSVNSSTDTCTSNLYAVNVVKKGLSLTIILLARTTDNCDQLYSSCRLKFHSSSGMAWVVVWSEWSIGKIQVIHFVSVRKSSLPSSFGNVLQMRKVPSIPSATSMTS